MPLAYVIVLLLLALILMVGFGMSWRRSDGDYFLVSLCFAAFIGLFGIGIVSTVRSKAAEANQHNADLMQILRLAEGAQQRYAPAHDGRFTARIVDLTQLQPRLVSPLAEQDYELTIERSGDGRNVLMTATSSETGSIFTSALQAAINQRPIHGCDVKRGDGCEDRVWR